MGRECCNQFSPLPPHRHHLCRSRRYCRDVGNCVETLSTQVERLVQQAAHQTDSSVALYYFNASLYLLRVLKGNTADRSIHKSQKKEKAGTSTKPKGPEVSRPWPRGLSLLVGSAVPVDRSRRQAAGRGHLPVSQMGT